MSRFVSVLVSSFVAVAAFTVVAGPAFAQDPPAAEPPAAQPPPVAQQTAATAGSVFDRPGLDLGVRLGYALPFGDVVTDSKLGDSFSGAVPLVLEAGYRINGNFTVGLLFQYAVGQTKNCDPGTSCSGNIVRLGLEGIYNFNLEGVFTPWLGLGTGYEWLGVSQSGGGQDISGGLHGFELFTAHAGGDFRVAPQFALGPFVSFSLAQYSTVTAEVGGVSASQDIGDSDKKMHEWLQLGVRGRFGI